MIQALIVDEDSWKKIELDNAFNQLIAALT
jgi:hypothetical protein